MASKFIFAALAAGLVWASVIDSYAQLRRHIKVVLQSRQSGTSNEETVQGSGGVIVRRGGVQGSGRLTADERHTTVQRSTGIFTLVQDGGESVLTVATRVPQSQIAFYHDYASGIGYIDRRIFFTEVGTSLRVSASVLTDGQIRVKLIPRISYFSQKHAGAIDLTEAMTELTVANAQPVSLGGSTTQMHQVTRRMLGYSESTGASDSHLIVTATVQ